MSVFILKNQVLKKVGCIKKKSSHIQQQCLLLGFLFCYQNRLITRRSTKTTIWCLLNRMHILVLALFYFIESIEVV